MSIDEIRSWQEFRRFLKICKKSDYTLFLSDVHWKANDKISSVMCKKIMNRGIGDTILFAGDVIEASCSSAKKALNEIADFYRAFSFAEDRLFSCVGNHDNNSYCQVNCGAILDNETIENTMLVRNKHYNQLSYYIDDNKKKIRYLLLNTSLERKIENQECWIQETLISTPNEYSVIVVAHIWYEWSQENHIHVVSEDNIRLLNLLDSYNEGKNQFTQKSDSNKVVLILGGHVHTDILSRTKSGIPIYITDCDCYKKSYSHEKCVMFSIRRQRINLFSIDSNGDVNLVRIGRVGKQRSYDFTGIN